MTLQITVHKPTLAKQRQPISIAPWGRSLTGQVWGFVDTSKVNADLFIDGIQTEIRQQFHLISNHCITNENTAGACSALAVFMLRMLHFVPLYFPAFPVCPGNSMQHERDMEHRIWLRDLRAESLRLRRPSAKAVHAEVRRATR